MDHNAIQWICLLLKNIADVKLIMPNQSCQTCTSQYLRDSDRHFAFFIMPFGRWRYKGLSVVFHITDNRIDPLPKFYNAIQGFPTTTSTTDIRGWFGLINQVANYDQLRHHLNRSDHSCVLITLLSGHLNSKQLLQHQNQLSLMPFGRAFKSSTLNAPTCLRNDCSKRGLGYFLLKKQCECIEITLDWCLERRRVTLAGSRLSSTEHLFALIDGEMLAIALSRPSLYDGLSPLDRCN